jgi:cob(I)alamin adenosyltransferase
MNDLNSKHKKRMQALKERVDSAIATANEERGLCLLLTGDGKAKSSSAFGMVMRSLGYGKSVAIVQFIKGEQASGEEIYIREQHPELPFYQMGTGFTWDTQDREADRAAARQTWDRAVALLQDESLHLLVLDELTYMLAFDYLDEAEVLNAIRHRPRQQHVVITGRGGGKALRELADTVAEVKNIKHAFESGIRAQEGIDY